MTSPPTLDHVRHQIDQLVRAGDTKQLRQLRDQLQSRLDRKRVAERTARYQRDPAGWVHGRLSQVVWTKQREILESVRDHRRTAVRSCHGVGKSHVAA